jgi:hypothetical protein
MLNFRQWLLAEKAIRLDHSLNIARRDLPQIRSAYIQDYLEWLQKTHHVTHRKDNVPASSLKPIQTAIESDRVAQLKPGRSQEKPIIVSSDHYILDGHHRWYQGLMSGDSLGIVRVSVDMKKLLRLTKDYPHVQYQEM